MSTVELEPAGTPGARPDAVPAPSVQRTTTPDVPRQRWESLAIFVVVTAAFTALGSWVMVDLHLVGFDALEHYTRALMVWHNNPPKLAAIGLEDAPLTTLVLTPLTVVSQGVSSLVVVPVGSAVFAGIIAVSLNTLMRRCRMPLVVRYAVLVALLANPLVAMYASSGRSQLVWIALYTISSGCLIAWYVTADIRFVMTAGLAFCLATLTDYSSLAWFAIATLLIAAVLSRLGARGEEIEGTVVGFSAPVAYVVALWCALNLLVLANPFAWLRPGTPASLELPLDQVLTGTWDLVVTAAPLALVVLPLLVLRAVTRRDVLAGWLAASLALTIIEPGVAAYFGLTTTPLSTGSGVLVLVASVIGAIWLARSTGDSGPVLALGLVAALLLSIPWTLSQMRDYRYQSVERAFADAITTGHSQEGERTRSGQVLGIDPELAMADYITTNVHGTGRILTDNAATYGVIALTGKPALFYDRIDRGDDRWRSARANPPAQVRYLLLSTSSADDMLRRAYPEAAQGGDSRLPVVYRTDRYTLVRVPSTFESTRTSSRPTTTDEQTTGSTP